MGGWVGTWVCTCQITKYQINLGWGMIPLPMGGFMGDWLGQWVGSCQISKNSINCDLIEIIQFCLNIYDMW